MEQISENDLSSIGFLFDSCHSKTTKYFNFAGKISIEISLIDDDPGHIQSGLYLWPAAECACQHLLTIWNTLPAHSTILELGAGCGLTGTYLHIYRFCFYTFVNYLFGSNSFFRNTSGKVIRIKNCCVHGS